LSKNQCATGFAVGHIAGKKTIRRYDNGLLVRREVPVIRFDVLLQVLPPEGEEIILNEVVNIIFELVRQGMPIQSVSFDSYQSVALIQQLKQEGFNSFTWSSEKPGHYNSFKQMIYDGCITAYEYAPLLKELRELERDSSGKVVKPEHGSKDIADACCCIATYLATRPIPRDIEVLPERGASEVVDPKGHVLSSTERGAGVQVVHSDNMWRDREESGNGTGDVLDMPFILG